MASTQLDRRSGGNAYCDARRLVRTGQERRLRHAGGPQEPQQASGRLGTSARCLGPGEGPSVGFGGGAGDSILHWSRQTPYRVIEMSVAVITTGKKRLAFNTAGWGYGRIALLRPVSTMEQKSVGARAVGERGSGVNPRPGADSK